MAFTTLRTVEIPKRLKSNRGTLAGVMTRNVFLVGKKLEKLGSEQGVGLLPTEPLRKAPCRVDGVGTVSPGL